MTARSTRTIDATANRKDADKNGGAPSRPIRIASQVEPQMRQSMANAALRVELVAIGAGIAAVSENLGAVHGHVYRSRRTCASTDPDDGPDDVGEGPRARQPRRVRSAGPDHRRGRRPAVHARDAGDGPASVQRDRHDESLGSGEDRRHAGPLGPPADAGDREDAPDDPGVLPEARHPAGSLRWGATDRPTS